MRPNRNGGIPPPIPKPRLQLWSPSRVLESLKEIEMTAEIISGVIKNLRPCLGTHWASQAKRYHRRLLKFGEMTAKAHRDIAAKRATARYPEVDTSAEYIPASREMTIQVKKPVSAARPKTPVSADDYLSKLAMLEDNEPLRDLERPVARPATSAVAAPRRKMAYFGRW